MNYHPDLVSTGLKMLTALAIVLGGLMIMLYYAKRRFRNDAGLSRDKLVRLLGNTYIGVKKHISLVEVPGALLVLGITSDSIRLLTKIENKEILDKMKSYETEKIWPSFSEQLNKISSSFKSHKTEKQC
jgi:flagellar biogenesis protein FliO